MAAATWPAIDWARWSAAAPPCCHPLPSRCGHECQACSPLFLDLSLKLLCSRKTRGMELVTRRRWISWAGSRYPRLARASDRNQHQRPCTVVFLTRTLCRTQTNRSGPHAGAMIDVFTSIPLFFLRKRFSSSLLASRFWSFLDRALENRKLRSKLDGQGRRAFLLGSVVAGIGAKGQTGHRRIDLTDSEYQNSC